MLFELQQHILCLLTSIFLCHDLILMASLFSLAVMEASLLNSFSSTINAPNKYARLSEKWDWCLLRRKKSSLVLCQGSSGGNAKKTSGFSSAATLMDAGSLVLSPNDQKVQKENNIAVKDLVPFVEMHDGIGIVKFLKGKGFFITGGTGFLAKGTHTYAHILFIMQMFMHFHENYTYSEKVFFFCLSKYPVLIEKILRTAPDVGKIYLLIKAKNKEGAMERLKSEVCFLYFCNLIFPSFYS